MEKPLLEMKRFGRKIHLIVEKLAKEHGIESMAGPQGQGLPIGLFGGRDVLQYNIKDIEQKLDISKSVASNLMKRMEKNGFIQLETSKTDKRAKYIRLTPQSQERMKKIRDFFDEMDRSILNGVSERELLIFSQVMTKFYQNIESLENGGKDV